MAIVNMLLGGGGGVEYDNYIACAQHTNEQNYVSSSNVSVIGYVRINNLNEILMYARYANNTKPIQNVTFYALKNCKLKIYNNTSTKSSYLKETVDLIEGHKYYAYMTQQGASTSYGDNILYVKDSTTDTTLYSKSGTNYHQYMTLVASVS